MVKIMKGAWRRGPLFVRRCPCGGRPTWFVFHHVVYYEPVLPPPRSYLFHFILPPENVCLWQIFALRGSSKASAQFAMFFTQHGRCLPPTQLRPHPDGCRTFVRGQCLTGTSFPRKNWKNLSQRKIIRLIFLSTRHALARGRRAKSRELISCFGYWG